METQLNYSLQNLVTKAPISLPNFLAATILIISFLCFYFRWENIYLIDFSCYTPPAHLRVVGSSFVEHMEICNLCDRGSIDLQVRVLEKSGISDESCMPVSVHEIPPDPSFYHTKAEVELVLFTVVKELLSKHDINPKSIDILVSNCSLFCPAPSITSMIINRFHFRSNIKSFSLSGMGCSAGILSISLAKDLLRVHKDSRALILSMEAVTPNGYHGKNKSMLVPNVLFRMGGAAILLSNRKEDKLKAKYKLQHLVRSHIGSNDNAYQSVFQDIDEDGHVGVYLSKELVKVAAKGLKTNISALGPLVLPYSEQLRFIWRMIWRRILPQARKKKELYVPDFKKVFDHFCIHAGGRAVIDAVMDGLKLQKEDGEASKMTLYRYGNTSSSSLWYELSYLQAKGRVQKGDRVWQIAFGSGFKCNSAVWKCISDLDPKEKSAWSDRIHLYPIDIPKVSSH